MEQSQNNKAKNTVEIIGWVKDNGIKYSRNQKNEEIISGNITVIVAEGKEFRLNYYCPRFKKAKPGEAPEESQIYAMMANLVDERTVSLAQVQKADPNATFENSKAQLTRVKLSGSLQENIYKDRHGEIQYTTRIRGSRGFVDNHPETFEPKAVFEITVYIDSIRAEMKDGEETGRLILVGVIPEVSDKIGASVINFVTEPGVASDYIGNNYLPTQTATICGYLVNLKTSTTTKTAMEFFGREASSVTVTKFVEERVINDGVKRPLEQDEEGAFSTEEIRNARTVREDHIQQEENATASGVSSNRGFGTPKTTTPSNAVPFNF